MCDFDPRDYSDARDLRDPRDRDERERDDKNDDMPLDREPSSHSIGEQHDRRDRDHARDRADHHLPRASVASSVTPASAVDDRSVQTTVD